ncbi:MAG: UvrB/UvrC motif-containing protein [Phycisphaerae bacterium]|jgi:hypothetical protein
MTLDLEDLLADWVCPAGEICARMVVGRDGAELLQLRVDLGVMQMFPDGGPDGRRYGGLPTVLDYIRHELRLSDGEVREEDWQELERELHQTNYRRLALSSLAEDALGRNEVDEAIDHLTRARRDTGACLEMLRVAAENDGAFGRASLALRPTLVFHHGRLLVQLRITEALYEEAVEAAGQAADELAELLTDLGFDDEQGEQDPGVVFLRDLEQRLRREYGISETLRERLAVAIEQEDFEAAARLRDELRRRSLGEATEGDDLD